MAVGGFGIVHKTNRAALDCGLSHGFDAMAARLERGKRLRGIAISAKSQHQRQCRQCIGHQMRVQ